jgi:hypothetical protein
MSDQRSIVRLKRRKKMTAAAEAFDWRVECDRETFEKCRADVKFPYVVALSRAANAMNFVHSAMLHAQQDDAPKNQRERLNSYFFASAILYEAIKLIRTMTRIFKDDVVFQNGLLKLLRDPVAQKIEQQHLNPARNQAVFHFMADTFAEIIKGATVNDCIFLKARGRSRKDVYYTFADVVASEILVGFASDSEEFYKALGAAMSGTRELVNRFADHAESLIGACTDAWGFKFVEGFSELKETGL